MTSWISRVPGLLVLAVWGCSLVAGPGDFTIERDASTDASGLDAATDASGLDAATDASGLDAATDAGEPTVCVRDEDCPRGPGVAVARCEAGSCTLAACDEGRGDCDGVLSNGCETDLDADVEHCGRCANACTLTNAVSACVDGACEIDRCLGGFGDCDESRTTGCEADLRSPATCGTCETTCVAPTSICDSAAMPARCVESCAAGAMLCETRCATVATDPLNCGACDRICDTPPNAEASCADGACGFECVGSFRDCDADVANGCERNTATSVDHCGACGSRCEGEQATWSCNAGSCAVAACQPGFEDCDENATNGCEADLTSSAHCGGCGRVCDGPCVDGRCDPVVDVAGNGSSLHRCLLRTSGRVQCWGANDTGQLGEGTLGTRATPTTVLAAEGSGDDFFAARAVSAGQASTCAIAATGTLWCWGRGLSGERGGGDATVGQNFSVPQPVVSTDAAFSGRGFRQIASGTRHHCALDEGGDVWCWGNDAEGQAGVGGGPRVSEATRVSGVSAVAELGLLADTSCARTEGERVLCWGANTFGQLGDGTTTRRATAAPVRRRADLELGGVIALATGNAHACALTRDDVVCWGLNTSREAGLPSGNEVTFATTVAVGEAVDAIQSGAGVSCVRRVAGGYRCWGRRTEGQRGDGLLTPNDATPTEPTGTASATRLLLRGSSGYAFLADGTIRSWGNDAHGALAQEPVALRPRPTPIVSPAGMGTLMGITSLSAGHRHACAVVSGSAFCWGEAFYNGFTGGGQDSATPRQVSALPLGTVHSVHAGYFTTGALVGDAASRSARAWGSNSAGLVGLGDTAAANPNGPMSPRTVLVDAPLRDLAYSATHGCALRGAGEVWCWGTNTNGELGRGTTTSRELTPAPIDADWTDAVELALGEAFSCARRANGEVWCWGAAGRLGIAMGLPSTSPVRVEGITRALALGAGRSTACVVEESAVGSGRGLVACWGSGPIGDGAETSALTPRGVLRADGAPLGDVEDVTLGAAHGCAVTASGRIWCWGRNENAEVGDGTTEPRLRAVELPLSTNAVQVTAADLRGHHTCALLADQTGVCWGDCRQGACGTGEAIYRPTPAEAEGLR